MILLHPCFSPASWSLLINIPQFWTKISLFLDIGAYFVDRCTKFCKIECILLTPWRWSFCDSFTSINFSPSPPTVILKFINKRCSISDKNLSVSWNWSLFCWSLHQIFCSKWKLSQGQVSIFLRNGSHRSVYQGWSSIELFWYYNIL